MKLKMMILLIRTHQKAQAKKDHAFLLDKEKKLKNAC